MKKLMIAFSFMLFVGSLAAANNVEQPVQKVATVASNVLTKEKSEKADLDPCVLCIHWHGGYACGAGETCSEALTCLIMCLE